MSGKVAVFIATLLSCLNFREVSSLVAAVGSFPPTQQAQDQGLCCGMPVVQPKARKAWLVGTWHEARPGVGIRCLHITQHAPGELAGWLASANTLGQYAPVEDAVKVQLFQTGVALIELYASSAMCCSHTFLATAAKNGTVMRANWGSGPNQAPHMTVWKKMPGDSCSVP